MTKWMVAGMSLYEVVKASTSAAAAAIGWGDRIGSLQLGRVADITVLERVPVAVDLEDCQSQLRPCHERLCCRAVWKDGRRYAGLTQPKAWPNKETIALQTAAWQMLKVRDPTPPVPPTAEYMASLTAGDRLMIAPAEDGCAAHPRPAPAHPRPAPASRDAGC